MVFPLLLGHRFGGFGLYHSPKGSVAGGCAKTLLSRVINTCPNLRRWAVHPCFHRPFPRSANLSGKSMTSAVTAVTARVFQSLAVRASERPSEKLPRSVETVRCPRCPEWNMEQLRPLQDEMALKFLKDQMHESCNSFTPCCSALKNCRVFSELLPPTTPSTCTGYIDHGPGRLLAHQWPSLLLRTL